MHKHQSPFSILLLGIIIAALYCSFYTLQAISAVFNMPNPNDDLVGEVLIVKVQPKDSITTLRQRYEISLYEILEANRTVDFKHLKVGQIIIIPTQYILPEYRRGIVINTAELRLYYFTPDGRYVYTYPLGLGRMDWRTPTIITKVVKKEYKPTWHVPESVREYMLETHDKYLPDEVPPGPENPLGDYALYLAKNGYLIHGTNAPDTVGTFASSGCIRMQADGIETIYKQVEVGTPVYIIHHANKAGWFNHTLYLESHVPVEQDEEPNELNYKSVEQAIDEATDDRSSSVYVNKHMMQTLSEYPNGMPTAIGKETGKEQDDE